MWVRLAVLTLGVLYPAYGSFESLDAKNQVGVAHWLTYWICLAALELVDELCVRALLDSNLDNPWRLYVAAKFALLVWLLSPITRGSAILYRRWLRPFLRRRRARLRDAYFRTGIVLRAAGALMPSTLLRSKEVVRKYRAIFTSSASCVEQRPTLTMVPCGAKIWRPRKCRSCEHGLAVEFSAGGEHAQ